jgi:predicted nucleotidyltransferase
MVKTRQEIENVISRYRRALSALGITAEQVILFGSYATGKAREISDIDLLIVSSDFRGKNIRERLELLGVGAVRIMEAIQAYGLTPEEVSSEEKSSFVKAILEEGRIAA